MSDKQIVVLISGSGSNLQAFIDAKAQNKLNANIVAVISNKENAYGLTRAKEAGIAAIAIENKDYPSREVFDQVLADKINTYQPDLVILAGFMRILSPKFVEQFKGKLLNIHPSLLPKYTGLHTHKRAQENKDEFHGTSVHFVTEELDGGPLIAQAKMRLDHNASEDEIMQQVQKLEHQLYPQVADWFLSGRITIKTDGIYFDKKLLEQPIHFS